jgi:CBS domain-containing protein
MDTKPHPVVECSTSTPRDGLPKLIPKGVVHVANPKAVSVDETIENCLYLMREFGFRHLPIVDGKELKGLVSSRDILLRYISQKEAEQRRIAG